MKILFVSNLYPPAILGGYEILCEQVCEQFIRRGHDISILTSDFSLGESTLPPFSTGKFGERIHRKLELTRPFGENVERARIRETVKHRKNERVTHEILLQEKLDLCFFWSLRRLTLGSVHAAVRTQIPFALTLNDDFLLYYWPRRPQNLGRKFVGYALDRLPFQHNTLMGLHFPFVTAISRSLVQDHLEAGMPLEHARIIYQGIPIEQFPCKENPGERHQPARILYAGQLHEYKGVHTVVEALILLKKLGYDAELTLAGKGNPDYEKRLHQRVKDGGVSESVHFLGRVDRASLSKLYQSQDLFVFSSIWREPFGLTHLEAMASGLPVISTTNGGPGEFLDNEENALTFEAGNTASLVDAIRKLMDDHELRRKIALFGCRSVNEFFTMNRYVDELELFLIDACDHWPQNHGSGE